MTLKRNTVQRALILEAVQALKNHATADEVYEEIAKKHPSISRGTVYRNLNSLANENYIHKIEIPDGADCFDHRILKHYHIKCTSCGKVFDVEMEYMEDLEKSIKDSKGFEFSCHDIMFKGICPDCKK